MLKLSKNSIENIILLLYSIALFVMFYGKIFFIGAHLIFGIIFFFSIIIMKLDKFFVQEPNKLFLPIILFSTLLVFGVIYTKAPNYGSHKALLFSSLVLPSLLISPMSLKLNKYLFVSITLLLLTLLIDFGSPWSILNNVSSFYRLGSDDNNPIILSRGLGLGVISGLFLLRTELSKTKKIIISILVFLFFIYMVFTASKGPVLAMLVSIGFYYLFNPYDKRIIKKLRLTIIIVSLSFFIIKFLDYEILFLKNRINNEGSFSSRLELYNLLLNNFYDGGIFNFLFGFGTGNFGFLYSGMDQNEYPHNMILEVLYENGIIGLIVLLTIIVILLFSFFKKKIIKEKIYLFVISIYFLINSFFTGDIAGNVMFFIFAYFALSRSKSLSLN